jgi:RNA polymerase sigma factor (sigma-70 family)
MHDEAHTLKTRPTLLSKVRHGDEDGWSRFYELYRGFIYSAARSAGLPHEDATDVVQETMVSVQNYIANFVPDATRGKFRTWLQRIVRSRIADRYRRKKCSPLDHVPQTFQAPSDETGTSPSERIANPREIELERLIDEKLEHALMEEARNRAKEKVRMEDYQAYDFFAVQQLTAKDVAISLRISPVTVRVRAHRVRRVVQRELRSICRILDYPKRSNQRAAR